MMGAKMTNRTPMSMPKDFHENCGARTMATFIGFSESLIYFPQDARAR
jgi:hypothetical protein